MRFSYLVVVVIFRDGVDDGSDAVLGDELCAVLARAGITLFSVLVDTSNVKGGTLEAVGVVGDCVSLSVNGEVVRSVDTVGRVDVHVLLLVDTRGNGLSVLGDDGTVALGKVAEKGNLSSKVQHGTLLSGQSRSYNLHCNSHVL